MDTISDKWKQNGAATRKKHPGGGKKKPGRCPKLELLMDPGPAAQTLEAKKRKIKRHAGQMPDTAWPSQGQLKMVGKNKDASHCLSKKRPPRKGRRQRRPEEIYVAIPAGVRQAIRTTTKAQVTSSARRRSAARPLQLRTSTQVSCNKVGPPAPPPAPLFYIYNCLFFILWYFACSREL